MAPTGINGTSSIARALAGMTESVAIPKPRDLDFWAGKDTFAAVAARSAGPAPKRHAAGLPTPPNSISPSLPPQADKARADGADGPPTPPGPVHVDTDIDLEDDLPPVDAPDARPRGSSAHRLGELANLDAAGAITPSMLAKHHLPGILLDHGPLAIRHVMGYLTTSVPGFSGIPPAKARRLVVGALEGRGSDGSQGGPDGDVMFEKVGWGRWDARKRGAPSRDGGQPEQQQQQPHPQTRRPSQPTGSLRIPIQSTHRSRRRKADGVYGSHQDSDQAYDSPFDDASVPEHEADHMSLDGEDDRDDAFDCFSSGRPTRPHAVRDDRDLGDMTDEEDWASIGAAALRQGSFPRSGGIIPSHSRSHTHVEPKSRGRGSRRAPGLRSDSSRRGAISKNRGATSSTYSHSHAHTHAHTHTHSPLMMAKSMPVTNNTPNVQYNHESSDRRGSDEAPRLELQQASERKAISDNLPRDMFSGAGDAQDREAVEALLKLSSF